MNLGELDLATAAKAAVGNWRDFKCFVWFRANDLADAAWKLKREYDLPKNWQGEVYAWLADNDCSAIEDTDDRGGYPNEEQLRAAFQALGY